MSKKATEFDRYERMKKIEREAEAEKRKVIDVMSENSKRKKAGRPKEMEYTAKHSRFDIYANDDEYEEIY